MNLFKAYDDNQLSPEGKAAFEALLDSEPKVAAAYKEYVRHQKKGFLHHGPHPILHVLIFLLLVAVCVILYMLTH